MTAPEAAEVTIPPVPSVTEDVARRAYAEQIRQWEADPDAQPLPLIGHVGTALLLRSGRYQAAMDRQWSPDEQWIVEDREARRQAALAHRPSDEEIAASIRDAIADLPVEPSRTSGPMSGLDEPIGDLDSERTEALHRFDSAHDYQDAPDRGHRGRRRGFMARWLGGDR